jgi:hypothetical protein
VLPSGKQIASHFDRHECWGRLVKHASMAGRFSACDMPMNAGTMDRGARSRRDVTGSGRGYPECRG